MTSLMVRFTFVNFGTQRQARTEMMLDEISGAAAGTAARNLGWRWGMWAPGLIGVVVGLAVLLFVRDSPEAVGFPPVEAIEVVKKKNTDGTDSEVGTPCQPDCQAGCPAKHTMLIAKVFAKRCKAEC